MQRSASWVQRAVWQLVYDSSYLTEPAMEAGMKSVWTPGGDVSTPDKGRSFTAGATGGPPSRQHFRCQCH